MRYNLLIEQLWHKTEPDHSDYEGLGKVRAWACVWVEVMHFGLL